MRPPGLIPIESNMSNSCRGIIINSDKGIPPPISISRIAFSAASAEDIDSPESDSPTTPNTRVRFHSRIRISSGTGKSHRYSRPQLYREDSYVDNRLLDPNSSLSSSPSSSISAPLRSRRGSDGESTPSAWPPLGKRIGMLAKERGDRVMVQNERTPLITAQPAPYQHYTVRRRFHSEEEEEAFYAAEIDRTFGPFPGRLLNSAWWRWQLSPVCVCTSCGGERGPYDIID